MERLSADLMRRSPHLLTAMKERVLDLRGNSISVIENLDTPQEVSAAAQKFHSKEAGEEAKKVAATKEQGLRVVSSTPAQIMAIKAAIVNSQMLDEVARLKKDQGNEADEQKQDEEIMGADSHSVPGRQHQIESYINKNFEQTLYNVMSSRRKRPYQGIHIMPPPRRQEPGDCAYHATLGTMEFDYKVMYARRPKGMLREFHVKLSHEHLKQMVLNFIASNEGENFRPRDLLALCLQIAKCYGVISEADWEAGNLQEAVRYKIADYMEISARQMKAIPGLLDKGKPVLTSFRVTDTYRTLLPHDIYRYVAEEDTSKEKQSGDAVVTHDSHCVVLVSHGQAYKSLHEVHNLADLTTPERYYEYLNSYSAGHGVDGCGYIYADSIRKSYVIRVAMV